eukprot:g32896.t1
MSFLSFTPALRRLTGVAVPQAGRCLVGAQARQQRWVARSFSSKVAVIQDQQIPKDEAMKALSGKGFDVSWSLAEPSDAWAIVTARGMRRVQGLQEFAPLWRGMLNHSRPKLTSQQDTHKHCTYHPSGSRFGEPSGRMSNLPAAVRMMRDQNAPAKRPRLEAGGMPLAYAHALASGAMFPRPGLLPAAALTPGPVLAAQTAAGLATAPGLAGLATLAAAASKAAPAAGLTAPAVLPAALASASSARPAAAAAASATLPAALSAASVPQRDPQEVKQALIHYGCVIPKEAGIRDLQMQLTDFEMHLKRAEATKKIRRHSDQAILACYKDGYSPGHEERAIEPTPGRPRDHQTNGDEHRPTWNCFYQNGFTNMPKAPSPKPFLTRPFRVGKVFPSGQALVKMLESGIDPDTPSTGTQSGFVVGMTPILAAASWGKVDDIRLLIAAGADMTARSPNIGHTVLHIAASASVDTGGVDRIHAMLRMIIDADPSLLAAKNGMGKKAPPLGLLVELYRVVVTNPVTKEVLDKHPKCKLVAVSFTGFNHVDLEACKERGISVVNVPAYSTDSVAELSVGLALAVYREIPAGERTLRAGGWVHSSGGMEIRDKVVGIVGLGDIGLRSPADGEGRGNPRARRAQRVPTAELFKAFGPSEILGWSRRPKAAFETLGKQVPIEDHDAECRDPGHHRPVLDGTIATGGSVLINVARGGVCDQPALADLLCQKRFRAGLDVFATEPIPADDPILKAGQRRRSGHRTTFGDPMQWSPEDAAVRRFFETGWEEVETLGRGARGPVVSIRRADGRGPISALKRSTHHEVEALKALSNCRNIVELEEIFLCSGQVLARLECMEGGSFRSYLRARPPGRVIAPALVGQSRSAQDVVRYVVGQVLEGLQDMHQSGWMHRDVKAENIGLGCELSSWGYRDCTVKLLDFDVAVEVGCGGLSEVIGTVENMAPEVFKGSYNELADIWSGKGLGRACGLGVGIITYEALYGYRPFNDANVDRIEEMVRNWQRYLLFPFDAAELPAHFIRLMLADPEDGLEQRRHNRVRAVTSSANCRSRSVKVSTVKLLEGLRDEPKDEIETSFTEWDQDTALVDDPHLRKSRRSPKAGLRSFTGQDSPSGQAVETLSRLRQGLSMWTNSRFAMVDGTDAADLGQQLGEGAGTSCSLPTRHASRFIPLKSECAEFRTERVPERGARHTDVTGSEAKTESLEDLEASSMVEDDTRDPSADQWHQSYLQRIRDCGACSWRDGHWLSRCAGPACAAFLCARRAFRVEPASLAWQDLVEEKTPVGASMRKSRAVTEGHYAMHGLRVATSRALAVVASNSLRVENERALSRPWAAMNADFPHLKSTCLGELIVEFFDDFVMQQAALELQQAFPDHLSLPSSWSDWFSRYARRVAREGGSGPQSTSWTVERRTLMRGASPKYVPRNWMLYEAYDAAMRKDYSVVRGMLELFRRPYEEQPIFEEAYFRRVPEWARSKGAGCEPGERPAGPPGPARRERGRERELARPLMNLAPSHPVAMALLIAAAFLIAPAFASWSTTSYSSGNFRVQTPASTLGDGELWTFGGRGLDTSVASPPFDYIDQIWAYNLSSDEWRNVSAVASGAAPSPRSECSAVYIGTNVWIYGGGAPPNTETGDLFTFDTSSNTWAQITPTGGPPPGRRAHAALTDGAGQMWVVGGYYSGATQVDTWIYNIAGNSWSQAADGPASLMYHSAVYEPGGGKIWLFAPWNDGTRGTMWIHGGYLYDGAEVTKYSDVWSYEIAGDTWTEVATGNVSADGFTLSEQEDLTLNGTAIQSKALMASNDGFSYSYRDVTVELSGSRRRALLQTLQDGFALSLALISSDSSSFALFEEPPAVLTSPIVSVQLYTSTGGKISQLASPLLITFPRPTLEGPGAWSTNGVTLVSQSAAQVTCAAEHLSLFALLLIPFLCSNAAAIFSQAGLEALAEFSWAGRLPAVVTWLTLLVGGGLLVAAFLMDRRHQTHRKQLLKRLETCEQVTYTKKRSMELPKETPNWWMPCRLDSLSVLLHGEDAKELVEKFYASSILSRSILLFRVHCQWMKFSYPMMRTTSVQRCAETLAKFWSGLALVAMWYSSTALAAHQPADCDVVKGLAQMIVRGFVVSTVGAIIGILPVLATIIIQQKLVRTDCVVLICSSSVSDVDGIDFLIGVLTAVARTILLTPWVGVTFFLLFIACVEVDLASSLPFERTDAKSGQSLRVDCQVSGLSEVITVKQQDAELAPGVCFTGLAQHHVILLSVYETKEKTKPLSLLGATAVLVSELKSSQELPLQCRGKALEDSLLLSVKLSEMEVMEFPALLESPGESYGKLGEEGAAKVKEGTQVQPHVDVQVVTFQSEASDDDLQQETI